jgi:hypothetical protein
LGTDWTNKKCELSILTYRYLVKRMFFLSGERIPCERVHFKLSHQKIEQAIPRAGNRLFPERGTGYSQDGEQAIPRTGNRLDATI